MVSEDIVQAGTKNLQAIVAVRCSKGVLHEFKSQTYEALTRAVLDAAEPLIRADQREKDAALIDAVGESSGWPNSISWSGAFTSRFIEVGYVARLVREGAEHIPATSDRSS